MNTGIERTVRFVKEQLKGAEAGHDWFHVERVWKLAVIIAQSEACDREVVELAALLHDIADPKFHGGDEQLAITIAQNHLKDIELDPATMESVLYIIRNMSFKNSLESSDEQLSDIREMRVPLRELHVVQDADRLDAIGAIGIARTFNFGGFKNNLLHHPQMAPRLQMTKEEYKKNTGTTINHFYEKLLLLKDRMNTQKGRELAEGRHTFMETFLQQFLEEWEAAR
ncbi:HD domain-containing protein [Marnyiella aurantia]|uniref:HD domain-containing protein n=1 Tax=Marnyiella aurantia TaxID=2758037 RepID=A0A7D7LQX9_9FLAO|nr:HD domain-containing protein [Marnyiella aurantia]MBA5247481.1 HD domain-containing protein [Marnyiella aurantia]QMS99236.1 HD domain-containing protein [Marnyiella aurantia]